MENRMGGYQLPDGRVIFASCVDQTHCSFCTVYQKGAMANRRYVSARLPIRKTLAEAEKDLARFAAERGLVCNE
ncbi:hypothetical protein [Sporomusa sp. KB1]|jgi:hypothetical protein|uniref:hypothetical protein n=1 Tax=Sporomusa sp. KB1 TaxID=943346 RepID=UPI00119FE4D0|nr:hypothetical protein [Sporomusa sp. KB1]TWH45928.1 hypothetical protein Salpa_1860 [Sporomusa sp. KB1]